MKSWKTTLAGLIAACCLWALQEPDLTPNWKMFFRLISALSVALLGLHAQDCPPNCQGNVAKNLNLLLLGLMVVSGVGCAVHGCKFGLSAPPFGSFSIDLRGGAVGKGACASTECPCTCSNEKPIQADLIKKD